MTPNVDVKKSEKAKSSKKLSKFLYKL